MGAPIPDLPPGGGTVGGGSFGVAPPAPSLGPLPPPGSTICGFKIPFPYFPFGFQLPSFVFPPKLPIPYFTIAFNCNNLSNPLSIDVGVTYGGGRTPILPADPDDDYDMAA